MAFNLLNVIDDITGPDENGRYRVYVNTTKAFPAAIQRIRELHADEQRERAGQDRLFPEPNSAEKPIVQRLFSDNPIDLAAWQDALVPLAEINPGEYQRIQNRALALETAMGFIMRSIKLMMIATGRSEYDTTTSRDIAFKLYYPLER